jgi:hypothetical protein
VTIFKDIVMRSGASDRLNSVKREFLIGYATSQINPGSLSHLDFLLNLTEKSHAPLLWYAVCAGLYPENEILKSFKCLGRRIQRDVLSPESPFSTPRHDISFEELAILLTADNPDINFRRAGQSFLLVEIFPCVTVQVGWQKNRAIPQGQANLFPSEEGAMMSYKRSQTCRVSEQRAIYRPLSRILVEHRNWCPFWCPLRTPFALTSCSTHC